MKVIKNIRTSLISCIKTLKSTCKCKRSPRRVYYEKPTNVTLFSMSEEQKIPYQKGISLKQAWAGVHAQRLALEETNAEGSALHKDLAGEGGNPVLDPVLKELKEEKPQSVAKDAAATTEDDPFSNFDPNMQASELSAIFDRLESGQVTATRPTTNAKPVPYARPRIVLRSFGTQPTANRQIIPPGPFSSDIRSVGLKNGTISQHAAMSAKTRRYHKVAVRAEQGSRGPPSFAGAYPSNYSRPTYSGGLAKTHPPDHTRYKNSFGLASTHPANYARSSNPGQRFEIGVTIDPALTSASELGGGGRADHAHSTIGYAEDIGNFSYEDSRSNRFQAPNYGGPGYFPDPYQNARRAPHGPASQQNSNSSSNGSSISTNLRVSPRFAVEYQSPYTEGSTYFGAKGYPHGRGGRGNADVGDFIPGTMVGSSRSNTDARPSPSSYYPEPPRNEQSNDGNGRARGDSSTDGDMSQTHMELLQEEYLNPGAYWAWLMEVCPQLAAEKRG